MLPEKNVETKKKHCTTRMWPCYHNEQFVARRFFILGSPVRVLCVRANVTERENQLNPPQLRRFDMWDPLCRCM